MMRSPANSRSRINRRRRMIKASTMGRPKPGSSASARRISPAGTSRISASSDFTRAVASAEVPCNINIADEVALPARGENLLRTFPRFEDFGFAAQDNGQPEIALPCLEDKLSALQRAPLPQRFQQRQLAIVEFRTGDALRIAVKLLVLIFFSHEIDCAVKSRYSRCSLRENLQLGQNHDDGPQTTLLDAKPFAQKRKLTFSRVWPATRASPNGCGTSTIGSVFSSNRIRRPSNTCNCWRPTLMIRSVMKSSPVKWAGRNCWTRRIGARRSTRSSKRTRTKRAISVRTRQCDRPRRLRSIVCIAPLLL